MKPCLDCQSPTSGTRCGPCRKVWESQRQARFPQRRAYESSDYRRLRARVLATRPACWLCGQAGADTLDHVLPLSCGGTNDPANLRPAHKACNVRRSNGHRPGH